MKIFTYWVSFFDSDENKMQNEYGFIGGESYADASSHLEEIYGSTLEDVRLTITDEGESGYIQMKDMDCSSFEGSMEWMQRMEHA